MQRKSLSPRRKKQTEVWEPRGAILGTNNKEQQIFFIAEVLSLSGVPFLLFNLLFFFSPSPLTI